MILNREVLQWRRLMPLFEFWVQKADHCNSNLPLCYTQGSPHAVLTCIFSENMCRVDLVTCVFNRCVLYLWCIVLFCSGQSFETSVKCFYLLKIHMEKRWHDVGGCSRCVYTKTLIHHQPLLKTPQARSRSHTPRTLTQSLSWSRGWSGFSPETDRVDGGHLTEPTGLI